MTRARRGNEPTDPWLIVTAVLAVVLLFLVIVAVIWLLGSGGEESASPTPSASGSVPAVSASPSAGASTEPSGGAASPSPGTSSAPSSAPSAVPSPSAGASPGSSASASPGASPDASACSGSEENQAFFAAAADKLSFDVYCAVLPNGWSLVSGSYRSASGGRLEISYKGPGGATLRLRQGPAACADDPTCPPTGTDAGSASFGDLAGTMLETDTGFAVVAGSPTLPYLAETTGLDKDGTASLAAALSPIR